MELCLGTVQFGMDYGVFDTPKKSPDYCVKCLDYATQNGISAIDTAAAYGVAEEVVGKFLALKTIQRDKLFISTKLMPNILDDYKQEEYVDVILRNLQHSLKTLHLDYVDTYLFHSSRYAFQHELLEAISKMKELGLAKHVGVSVYYPDEALACFENDCVDYIQSPYSVFDHRMKKANVFEIGESKGFSIDTRTAFIKGLIRLHEDEIPAHLSKAKPILKELDSICDKTGYSRIELAIGYVKREKCINHLVFGIRTLEQLKEDIGAFEKSIPNCIFDEMDIAFSDIPADLVVPSLWVRR